MNRYYVDTKGVEHECCWNSAIVRNCANGEGWYGGDYELVCECSLELAQTICDALNASLDSDSSRECRPARVQRPVAARDEPPHGDDTRGVLTELRDRLVLHANRLSAASNLAAIGMRVAVDFVNEALLASDKESP